MFFDVGDEGLHELVERLDPFDLRIIPVCGCKQLKEYVQRSRVFTPVLVLFQNLVAVYLCTTEQLCHIFRRLWVGDPS